MYLLYAPPKRFGLIPTGAHLFSNELTFHRNAVFTHLHFWYRILTKKGLIDISSPQLKKLRCLRQLKAITIIATGGIGDTIWTMPFARHMRTLYPAARISVIVSERSGEIWRATEYITNIIPETPLAYLDALSRSDEVFYFGGVATVEKDLVAIDPIAAIFKMAGVAAPKDRKKMTPKITLMLKEGLDAEETLKKRNIDAKKDTIISIGVHSSTPNRDWCITHIKALSGMLKEKGWKVIWLGSQGPQEDAYLTPAERLIPTLNLVGKTTLRETAAIIATSNVFVGPNSGLMVIAGSLGIPTVGLFGAFSPKNRTTFFPTITAIWRKQDCHPCEEHWTECPKGHPAPCMRALLPQDVLDAVQKLLEKYPKSYSHRGAYN